MRKVATKRAPKLLIIKVKARRPLSTHKRKLKGLKWTSKHSLTR